MLLSDVNDLGTNNLPLAKLLNASIESSFVFLNGIISSGVNCPDNFPFKIAVAPQYTQKVADVCSSVTISAPQLSQWYVTYSSVSTTFCFSFSIFLSNPDALSECFCISSKVYSAPQ